MRRLALALAAATMSGLIAVVPASAIHLSPQHVAAAAQSIALPPANGRFDYQIGGAYKPLPSVTVVDRDRTSHPAKGVYNICYVNAFQTQAYQDSWWKAQHSALLLRTTAGKLVEDPGWPGEILLDTATASDRTRLASVIGKWIDGCAAKGFNAVEPDNLDSN